ncbi:MAG: helix-hairpin-helix domain-containing protein [Ignavibacteria bacterium]|nr:helix-hairpin-helix domain-containing protein [Ignavibacteria bacterium]
MGKDSLLNRFQEFVGVTKNEATVALVIVLGLSIGVVVRQVNGGAERDNYNAALSKTVTHILDSIALAERRSFTGIDDSILYGNTSPALIDSENIQTRYKNSTNAKKALPTTKVKINSATKAELIRLPGIGEAMAERIIERRRTKYFMTSSDLMNVKGIGRKKLEKLEPYIVVDTK